MEALPTINAKQKKLRINFQLKQLFFATFFYYFCTCHSFHILTNWFETFIVNSLLRMSLSVSQLIKGYSNNINCILERLLVDIRFRTCASPDTKSHPLDLAIRSFIYLFIRSSVHYIIQMSLEVKDNSALFGLLLQLKLLWIHLTNTVQIYDMTASNPNFKMASEEVR